MDESQDQNTQGQQPGKAEELVAYLAELRAAAGGPLNTEIARRSGLSTVTITTALRDPRMVAWKTINELVLALRGGVDELQRALFLHRAARAEQRPYIPTPEPQLALDPVGPGAPSPPEPTLPDPQASPARGLEDAAGGKARRLEWPTAAVGAGEDGTQPAAEQPQPTQEPPPAVAEPNPDPVVYLVFGRGGNLTQVCIGGPAAQAAASRRAAGIRGVVAAAAILEDHRGEDD